MRTNSPKARTVPLRPGRRRAPLQRLAALLSISLVALVVLTAPAAALDTAEHAAVASDSFAAGPDSVAAGPRGPLSVGPDERLVERSRVVDPDGTAHVRYDRTWRGLRVVGGDAVAAVDRSGAVRVTWANGRKNVVPDTRSATSQAAALSVGRRAAAADAALGTAAAERIVWAASGMPRLAWDVVTTGVQADQTPTRRHTVVDAGSGAVIATWDDVKTGVGDTMYSGRVSVSTTPFPGGFALQDRSGNRTVDLFGTTSGTGTLVTDSDDLWGDGTPANRQTAAVEAQYGAQRTQDYLRIVHGRNGIWGDGQGVTSFVHFGVNYANAFWQDGMMAYGDGPSGQRPFTALDIAAHEMSHGVSDATAAFIYVGESGALSESTSDIFATDAEFWVANPADPGDYQIGEQLHLAMSGGGPVRYLDRPSRDGKSADCWTPGLGALDVHYSSGLFNHWFYLASEGSGAKTINGVAYDSPTCTGASVTGVGRSVAARIWYRALTTKLTSGSGFVAGRDGAIASARELYGVNSQQCLGVERAFDALVVPVGGQSCAVGEASVASFVTAAYVDFLGRQPSTAELAAAVTPLLSGATSRESFLRGLATSPEWVGAIVRRMYLDTLGREPDPAGLATWVDWIRTGRFTVAQTAALFYSSQEFYAGIGGGTDTTWVTKLYEKLLNRAPDPSGLAFWVGYAAAPAFGRGWVATQFYGALESRLTRVRNLYQALLARDPDPTGWPFWAGVIQTGGDLELAVSLAASTEYFLRAAQRF